MPSADVYALTRDAKESARLNAQHEVWKANVGFLLHPKIAKSIPSNARIGDVGTGTGVWIIDLAKEQKDSQYSYEGLDMSADQFPSKPPKDVVFSTLVSFTCNLLDPIPEDKKGTFDVLHLRLLVLGLPQGTAKVACENLLQLLRPGGWVQWEEGDFTEMKVVQQELGASTRSMQQAFDTVIDNGRKRGQGFDDLKNLASMVSSAGFEDVTTDIVSSDRVSGTRAEFNKTTLGALVGMIEMFKKMDCDEGYWSSDEPVKMLEDANKDAEGGKAYYRAELNVVTARKGQ